MVVLGREGIPYPSAAGQTGQTEREPSPAWPGPARSPAPLPAPLRPRSLARLPPARLELQRRGEDGVLD